MPFTQPDLDALETALAALRDGTRKISLSGENGAINYLGTSIPDLLKLRDTMTAEIAASGSAPGSTATKGRVRVFLTRYRSGL